MSVRENIEIYYPLRVEQFLETLSHEDEAQKHPDQAGAFIVEGLPFYRPRYVEDHISILSFNKVPLPYSLLRTLVEHPELVPDDVLIRWTIEQELLLDTTIGEIRRKDF